MAEKEYVVKYDSVEDLIRVVDAKINSLRAELGELLGKIDDISIKLEKLRLVYDKFGMKPEETVIEKAGVKIIYKESPETEQEILSEIADELQRRIDSLRKFREFLDMVKDIDLPVVVYWSQGVPRAIVFKTD